jgi:hypothetical protein
MCEERREDRAQSRRDAMKVRDLMELLEAQDPDAEVCMVTQPSWPIEYAVAGVAVRSDLFDVDVEPGTERYEDGTSANDVVLVEGRWLRYGQRTAWKAVQWSQERVRIRRL